MYPRVIILIFFSVCNTLKAQIPSGVYHFEEKSDEGTVHHEIKIDSTYFIYSEYETSPAKFIRTMGGFPKAEEGGTRLVVQLEFNSNFESDTIQRLSIPMKIENDHLVLDWKTKMSFKPAEKIDQDLDGQWLFATRGPDEGQERRGEENPRKTLKFLMDGRFQWIAYHTGTFKFFGTGGGSFTSKDGVYIENVEFFSRDDSRVGASLKFNYEVEGNDWHHTGKNSKGEPMYEIWARR